MPSSSCGHLTRRAILPLLSAGALWGVEPKITTPSYNTLSEEEELQLGRKFAAAYEAKVELLDSSVIHSYLTGIVKKLAAVSQRPDWPYQVQVVNSGEINACAIPGGFLYVQRGLLEFVEDENEMVGAIAHEIGHVVARHTTNQLMLAFIARHLYERVKKSLLLDDGVFTEILEKLGGPVVVLAQLRYSRANESEADLLGFYEMLRAGWNPNGLLKFFTRLQAKEGSHSAVDVMLSDHPATEERARVMRQELESVKSDVPMTEQTLKFRALKLALSLMPGAPRTHRS